jgi:hypothetical protein
MTPNRGGPAVGRPSQTELAFFARLPDGLFFCLSLLLKGTL